MTEAGLPLAELLAKAGGRDFLRNVAEAVLQMLIEADVEGLIGAGRHERTGERLNCRNGFRDRTLATRLGQIQLRIPLIGVEQRLSFPGSHRCARTGDQPIDFPHTLVLKRYIPHDFPHNTRALACFGMHGGRRWTTLGGGAPPPRAMIAML